MSQKQHKGKIENWSKRYFSEKVWAQDYPDDPPVLGYFIVGIPVGHPEFVSFIRTSPIVKHEGNQVETLNSIYELGTENKDDPRA